MTNNKIMHNSKVSDLIRKYFSAYKSKDRKALEDLLSDDFTFTSPYDEHIGKTTYFKRYWPNNEKIHVHHIEKLFVKGNQAFVRYELELKDGIKFRNAEYFNIEENKIKEVEVYFGSLPKSVLLE